MAVSKRLRFEVLKRDNHTCRYCGATAPDAVITIDHVVPVALGGTDDASNLVTACRDCNYGKSSIPADAAIVADVAADAMRWSRAMQAAAQAVQLERDQRDALRSRFRDHWDDFSYGSKYNPRPVPIGDDWTETVDRFITTGLTIDDLLEAADIAMRKQGVSADNTWRYFCGVAWRMLTDRQEAAQRIASSLATDEGA